MKFLLTSLLPIYVAAFAPSRSNNILQNQIIQSTDATNTNNNIMALQSSLTTAELPQKLYFPKEKEVPKVLGGIKIGTRKLTVITGASSGLGLNTAATLVKTGRHFVVMAVRDVEKAKRGKICRRRRTF